MADTSSMMKDLISTVEEKVNKPLSQSTGALTSEFYSDPSSTRQRIVTENASNPLNPLAIDSLVGQRRGSIGGQIAGNTSLAGANADILGNFFNLINQQAERASATAARNAASRQASKKNYDIVQTAEGLRAYDPETGTFGPVIGQGPKEKESVSERQAREKASMIKGLREDILGGMPFQEALSLYPIDANELAITYQALGKDHKTKDKSLGGFFSNKETWGGIGAGAGLGAAAGSVVPGLGTLLGAGLGGFGGFLGAGVNYLGNTYN